MSNYSREELLKMINPFGIYKNLDNKSNSELNDILNKLQNELFLYSHEDYIGLYKNTKPKRNNDNVRKPDEYKTEKLVDDYPVYKYDDDDNDIKEALKRSIEETNAIIEAKRIEYEEYQEYQEYDNNKGLNFFDEEETNDTINDTNITVNNANEKMEKYDMEKLNDRPLDVSDEFIINFCELWEDKKYEEAKKLINNLSAPSCGWLYRFQCGKTTFRSLLKAESPDLHTYFTK
jgi:hypothetical protein